LGEWIPELLPGRAGRQAACGTIAVSPASSGLRQPPRWRRYPCAAGDSPAFRSDAIGASRHSQENLKKLGKQLDTYFRIQSYGKVWIECVDVSPVSRLASGELYEREQMIGGDRRPMNCRRSHLPRSQPK
jgi:hypothetical protein